MKANFSSLLFLVVASFMTLLTSCDGQHKVLNRRVIAVSIEPLRYFTEQIASGRFDVQTVVPEGYSPETYEPSPQQLVTVSDAKAYFKVGNLGFESIWFEKISKNEPNLPIFNTSDSLELSADGMKQSTFDQHTWTSPKGAEVISRSICRALCQLDSANAPGYKENLKKLLKHIQQVNGQIHKTLKNIPSRVFVTAHPSFSYFASEYGLVQLCIEKDGKEPTPSELAGLIRQAREQGVKVVLVQPETSSDNARLIAREIGALVVQVNPLSYHWDKEILHVASALRKGK